MNTRTNTGASLLGGKPPCSTRRGGGAGRLRPDPPDRPPVRATRSLPVQRGWRGRRRPAPGGGSAPCRRRRQATNPWRYNRCQRPNSPAQKVTGLRNPCHPPGSTLASAAHRHRGRAGPCLSARLPGGSCVNPPVVAAESHRASLSFSSDNGKTGTIAVSSTSRHSCSSSCRRAGDQGC